MKKKILPILMALTMTAAAISGCSAGSQGAANSTAAADSTTVAADSTTVAADSTTVTTDSTTAQAAANQSKANASNTSDSGFTLRIGSLKGPTTMGLVELMDQSSKGTAKGSYDFSMVTAPDEMISKIAGGSVDVALVPANMASVLYNKTKHGISVIDINTLGVLYVVSADDSIHSIADLKGKTVYVTDKGATPDYVLQYLLKANGLTTDDVNLEYKSEPTEVAALLKEKPNSIGLLPQPFVTVAMSSNDSLKMVLDLTKEWDRAAGKDGSSLVTGVTICRNEVLKDHPEVIQTFMAEQKASSTYANENVADTAKLVAAAGIVPKAPIAEKAIPYCSISYLDGNDMKSKLQGYLSALYGLNPVTVGGTLPGDDFYYLSK